MNAFYEKTFQLLRTQPRVSPVAVVQIEAVEARLCFPLPATVREWYSYENAIEILAKHSNEDPPIPLDQFAVIQWQSQQLLPFRYENQGVCTWAIMLDNSDDPPVYVDVDSNGTQWHLLTPAFSEYVYTSVWDYANVFQQSATVQAQNRPLSQEALSRLRQLFTEQPKTFGWPGSIQYRFTGPDGCLLIWAADGQVDWWVGASNQSSLEKILLQIWDLDPVGNSFREYTNAASAVLDTLRQGRQSADPAKDRSTPHLLTRSETPSNTITPD